MKYFYLKKSKKVQAITLSIFISISLVSCSIVNNKPNLNYEDTNNKNQYISISSTDDTIYPGRTEVSLYDSDLKKIETKTVKEGGFGSYFESESSITFLGGKSILTINKASGLIENSKEIINNGVIELIDNQGDNILFIKNNGIISKTEYNSEVCEITNFDTLSIDTFSTDNSLAMDAIVIDDIYYVLSRTFDDSDSSRMLEIYDENKKIIKKIPLDETHTFYQFFKQNDDLYLIGTLGNSENSILKLNKDYSIENIPTVKGFIGDVFIDSFDSKLYFSNQNGVFLLDIDNANIVDVFSSEEFDNTDKSQNDYTFRLFFTSYGKGLRVIKRSLKNSEEKPVVKIFMLDNDTNKFNELNVNIDESLIGIYFNILK